MRAALVVAVAVAMATQATAGLARPPTLRRWALSTCEVRARERLNASGSNFAGTGDRDQQECSTIDHLSGQCSPSFTDGTGDGAELVGITYLVSPELAPESIAAPQTLPPQLSVTLTSEGIVCSAGVTTIALVVIGGMCMWRATRGKHYRAAATMQAAARGFLARLLSLPSHAHVPCPPLDPAGRTGHAGSSQGTTPRCSPRRLAPSPPAPRCLQSSGGCTWLSRTTPSTCSSIPGSALGSPPLSGGRQRPPWRTSGWQRESGLNASHDTGMQDAHARRSEGAGQEVGGGSRCAPVA